MEKLDRIAELCIRLGCDFKIASEWYKPEDSSHYKMGFCWTVEGPARGMSNSAGYYSDLSTCIESCAAWLEGLTCETR